MVLGSTEEIRTPHSWGWDVVNMQFFSPVSAHDEALWGHQSWEAPRDLPEEGGDVKYYICGAGQGGHFGYAAQWGVYRRGGPGGQGGQWVTGTTHTKELGRTEEVHCGSTFQMSGTWSSPNCGPTEADNAIHYAGLITFMWPAYLGATEWNPGGPSSFAGITALGGGMGFTSTPNDAGSGGDGGFLGTDNADQPGQPGTLPAILTKIGAPAAAAGQVAGPGLSYYEATEIRGGEQGFGSYWMQWINGAWVFDWQLTTISSDAVFFPGGGGGGGASTSVDGDYAGDGGSGSGVGGGGGGGGSAQRAHWVRDEFWWWWGWEGPASGLSAGPGFGGGGGVTVVTSYRVLKTSKQYLRMAQRNDGIGVARHPRLQVPGANEPSSKQSRSIRLGETNTYR